MRTLQWTALALPLTLTLSQWERELEILLFRTSGAESFLTATSEFP
ncbi:MAG: hypothetical protein LPK14_12560 [Hymenobacteraceae bacterium]|nr:hypothetical protein [Hymenobacteraceae bacterium]